METSIANAFSLEQSPENLLLRTRKSSVQSLSDSIESIIPREVNVNVACTLDPKSWITFLTRRPEPWWSSSSSATPRSSSGAESIAESSSVFVRVCFRNMILLNCAETVEKKISKILHFERSALKEQSIMRPSAARTSSSSPNNIVPLLTDDDSDDENKRLDRELHKDLVNSLRDTVSACFYRGEFQLYSTLT